MKHLVLPLVNPVDHVKGWKKLQGRGRSGTGIGVHVSVCTCVSTEYVAACAGRTSCGGRQVWRTGGHHKGRGGREGTRELQQG